MERHKTMDSAISLIDFDRLTFCRAWLVSGGPSLAHLDEELQLNQFRKIKIGGVVGHLEGLPAPTAGHESCLLSLDHDLFLALVELRLDGGSHRTAGVLRCPDAVVVSSRAGQGDHEKAVLLLNLRLVQP